MALVTPRAFARVSSRSPGTTDSALAPFLLDGVATDPALMQDDGLHPNPAAQARLLQNILPTIQTVLAN